MTDDENVQPTETADADPAAVPATDDAASTEQDTADGNTAEDSEDVPGA